MTAQTNRSGIGEVPAECAATDAAGPFSPVGEQLDLRDIHLPEQPGFWPPAPGWWLLAAVLLAVLISGGRLGWRAWRRWRRRRVLLAELERLRADLDAGPALAAAVSALLKRVALSRYPRAEVAPLTGDAWLAFLERTGGEGRFAEGPGRALADAPYAPDAAAVDGPGLLAAARSWLLRNS
ncbi:DUF4381 domain-containing protein [Halochromatium glycolicum]|uniref:DUF4381 domain-containing protein n=1 Tax=Halochromatium glycolicum TaxID=85075 RepID=UPI0030B86621